MKKALAIILALLMVLGMLTACGKTEKAEVVDTTTQNVVISEDGQMAQEVAEATENLPEVVEEGTEIVPAAATEVLPAAAPGPDAGGKVATEVVK